jgi:transaldolase
LEIFLDSGNVREIQRWMDYGVLDGVTTNPTILLKDGGYDVEERTKEIASLIAPLPLSVEVYTNDHREMLAQARTFASWAGNIVVKIPVINEYGEPSLGVVKQLGREGIRVNVTACLSLGQVVLAAKAGATYISIFAGRVSDEGHDAPKLIRESVGWLRSWGYSSRIIVGSIREAINVQDAVLAGAHIVTVPPQFLDKWVDHHYTRATVRGFNEDAKKALARAKDLAPAVTQAL